MYYLGVDACRKGWFVVATDGWVEWTTAVCSDIREIWDTFPDAALILIDMPIGLPYKNGRTCDHLARRLLGRRRSSVFSPPARPSLYETSYRAACERNRKLLGKKLSKQTWNICRKMAEVDLFLRENKEARAQFREAHPELCFWALASGHPMTHPKRSYQGHRERMRLLRKVDPSFERLLHSTLSEYPRREVAADDVLDALVLAVAATGQLGELKSLPAEPEWDEEGLPMEIVFPDNQSHQPEIEG